MSYNPETGFLYICAMKAVSGYTRSGEDAPPVLGEDQPQPADLGGTFTTAGFGNYPGYFGAWNPTTGEIEWQKRWAESCYSGTVTTGGNLVFVGRNTGHLEAYHAQSGERLWRWQTGSGANSTITTFEWKEKQYIAFAAGGNSLAATPHGDDLWLFSLDGDVEEAEGVGTEPGGGAHAGQAPTTPPEAGEGDAEAGQEVWTANCSTCHGLDGTGANGGPDLTNRPGAENLENVRAVVTNGRNGMPAFRGQLTEKQINDVSAYVVEEIAGGDGG
jgi:alcohol dehydrogenase (cytochrome c)